MIEVTLKELVKLFDNNDILYGVGGSFMIDKHHFDLQVNDIDIFISQDDINKIEEVMTRYQKTEVKDNPLFKSGYYAKYLINGIGVDIMANMVVSYKDMWYSYDLFDETQIRKNDGVNYMYLQDWFYIYWIMRRYEKIKMINSYWQKTKYPDNDRWHYLLSLNLPKDLMIIINDMIKYGLCKQP